MNAGCEFLNPLEGTGHWTVGMLATALPPFNAATTCGQAFEWFRQHPTQIAAAVVDEDNRVVGIVNRLRFLARYAQPFIPELYSDHPATKLGNIHPLIVDGEMTLAEFGPMITLDWPDALRECFVVTQGGRYSGVGTAEALVRRKFELLAERERQLNAALAEARDASKAKSNFLALMSHELRTPLNAIIGFSEVLSCELFGSHAVAKYRDYSADIHRAGRHLLELINNILDLSKLEAGKFELHYEAFDVGDLIDECLKLVSAPAADQRVTLERAIPDALPDLDADRLRVKQIILNLLSNAIKFTPSGGKVTIAAEERGNGLAIVVRDTGIGMAPDMIPVALEPFRQIASPFAREVSGTGLGLSLVKSLIELHGGSIAIESALSAGTEVVIAFPPELARHRERMGATA